jgi:hypothetical protein
MNSACYMHVFSRCVELLGLPHSLLRKSDLHDYLPVTQEQIGTNRLPLTLQCLHRIVNTAATSTVTIKRAQVATGSCLII